MLPHAQKFEPKRSAVDFKFDLKRKYHIRSDYIAAFRKITVNPRW